MPSVKVGTCNYCGSRAALVLQGKVQHELACATCGAPLHDLKKMPVRDADPVHHRARPASSHERAMSREDRRPKYKKQRKSWKRRAFEEIFDLVEDIFD